MPAALNLTGEVFGRLTAIEPLGLVEGRRAWLCRCTCGNTKIASGRSLRTGSTRSCGCMHAEANAVRAITHGESETPEYATWCRMKARCLNQNTPKWERYGGRGVIVCAEWIHSFANFLADMGPRPSVRHSLDRIDNNGNYEPSNCRWATAKQQADNRSITRWIEHQGVRDTLTGWSSRIGIRASSLHTKLKNGETMQSITSKG